MALENKMNIERCLEILELEGEPRPADIRQAYKDLVNVWHPDRFLHNPRLRAKAERKLKDINTAYNSLISRANLGNDHAAVATGDNAHPGEHRAARSAPRGRTSGPAAGKTEQAVEYGTRAVLTVCYSLYKAFNHALADLAARTEKKASKEERRHNETR